MPTPEFVLNLRSRIGHDPIVLVGVTAVVIRGNQVLLGQRSDNGLIAPVTGIVDPGEEPAIAAAREVSEEAGVVARATDLVWVHQIPTVTHGNGDQVNYLDLVFRCEYISGEPEPVDGEMSTVFWRDIDSLDDVRPGMQERIRRARIHSGSTTFEL